MKRKIILYIAMSLDGFIAREDGKVDWLDEFNETGEDYGYNEFYSSINSIIMGNNTYRQFGGTKEFEDYYKDKPIYVFSKKEKGKKKNATYVNDFKFVDKLDGNVWMLGGAKIADEFLRRGMIDEMIISIIPIVLGKGIRLFEENDVEKKLKLVESKAYDIGLVQVRYEVVN